jgi:hypothetical protein
LKHDGDEGIDFLLAAGVGSLFNEAERSFYWGFYFGLF